MEWESATWQLRHALLLLFLLRPAAAQLFSSPPPPNPFMAPVRPSFNPGMAAIVIALISLFLVLAFFSIYFRSRRALQEMERLPAAGPIRVNAAAGGLDPAVIESFPKFVYSEVKQHKIGKGALECAVCLSEFEDSDTLRLLPKCDHVFHPDCIDSWFASHTTCPVCRTNLAQETAAATPPEAVVITVVEGEVAAPPPQPPAAAAAVEEEEELPPLPPGRQRRKIPRSHSTGHSLAEDRERYTLRLPETIRRDVVAGVFTRSTSCYAGGGESSARKGVGEIGGGGRSSFKTRTWERWASFKRSFSARGSRGEDAGGSGGADAAVDRSLSKKKEVRYAEEGSVNVPV